MHGGGTRSLGCPPLSGAGTCRTELCSHLSLGKSRNDCLKPSRKIFKCFKAVAGRHFLFSCPCFCHLFIVVNLFCENRLKSLKKLPCNIHELISVNSSVLKVSFCLLFHLRGTGPCVLHLIFAYKSALVRGISLSLCFPLLDPLLEKGIFLAIQCKSTDALSVLCGGSFPELELTENCVYWKFCCTEATMSALFLTPLTDDYMELF